MLGMFELLVASLMVFKERMKGKSAQRREKKKTTWPNGDFTLWGMAFDKDGNPKKMEDCGYNADGYDSYGFDHEGYDRYGYDIDGRDKEGRDRLGYDRDGFDKEGFDRNGFDRNGKSYEDYAEEQRRRKKNRK